MYTFISHMNIETYISKKYFVLSNKKLYLKVYVYASKDVWLSLESKLYGLLAHYHNYQTNNWIYNYVYKFHITHLIDIITMPENKSHDRAQRISTNNNNI